MDMVQSYGRWWGESRPKNLAQADPKEDGYALAWQDSTGVIARMQTGRPDLELTHHARRNQSTACAWVAGEGQATSLTAGHWEADRFFNLQRVPVIVVHSLHA
jgi:hypothetical protein